VHTRPGSSWRLLGSGQLSSLSPSTKEPPVPIGNVRTSPGVVEKTPHTAKNRTPVVQFVANHFIGSLSPERSAVKQLIFRRKVENNLKFSL
jgi:hypothetical protein